VGLGEGLSGEARGGLDVVGSQGGEKNGAAEKRVIRGTSRRRSQVGRNVYGGKTRIKKKKSSERVEISWKGRERKRQGRGGEGRSGGGREK